MIRLSSRSFAVCIATILLASTASAQQRQSQARSTAPAAAEPSAAHVALARELITINGLSALVDPFLPQFSAQIRKNTVTRPELTKDLDQVLETIKPEVEKQKESMIETTARYYANAFSEAELKELLTFFKSQTGQKYLQLSPRILNALGLEAQRWAERMSTQVMTRVRAEMAKRGHQM